MSSLRILAISAQSQGANDYAFVRAFRRAGHSVQVLSQDNFRPTWASHSLRLVRRLLVDLIAREFNEALLDLAARFRPDLVFVFKGELIKPHTIQKLKDHGVVCIQFYPDTGFGVHSKYLLDSIVRYDWVFTTKPDHPDYLLDVLNFRNVEFCPHAFDPEVHYRVPLSQRDIDQYRCDVGFVGNPSNKKVKTISSLVKCMPEADIRVWGASGWRTSEARIGPAYQGGGLWGTEYAKAIGAAKICLGLLYEGNADGNPDTITARTFEIPAAGGFMLHERTDDAMRFFEDGRECIFFDGHEDLVAKIRHYLVHPDDRLAIANAGFDRCQTSGYSVDERVRKVVSKYDQIRSGFVEKEVRSKGFN